MNEEFNELFEIKDEKNDESNLPAPKQNVFVHSIIRAVILIIATVLTCGILFVAALGGEINLAILAAAIVILWFVIMIIETIRLNKKKCTELATSNVILIVIALVLILGLTAYMFNLR